MSSRQVAPGVRQIDDLAAFFRDVQRGEAAALEAASPEQAAITWGDFFERVTAPAQFGYRIFGRIATLDEFKAAERGLGAGPEELRHEVRQLKENYAKGRRYGRCFSVKVPEGEPGSTHVVDMKKITEAEFNEAKARGWA